MANARIASKNKVPFALPGNEVSALHHRTDPETVRSMFRCKMDPEMFYRFTYMELFLSSTHKYFVV